MRLEFVGINEREIWDRGLGGIWKKIVFSWRCGVCRCYSRGVINGIKGGFDFSFVVCLF